MKKNISLFYTNIENKDGIDELFLALEKSYSLFTIITSFSVIQAFCFGRFSC